MLKVIAVVDKKGTALDRLARGVEKYYDNIEYTVIDVHPKRPSEEQLQTFYEHALNADVFDWQYYKTAEMLRARYPFLSEKKHILTHNNPYAIHEQNWNNYDMVVANNKTMYEDLKKITSAPLEYVPLVADADFWEFNRERPETHNVIMVANRIESKKGILPVAIACADLNLHFILVGNISDMAYFNSIMQAGNVEYHENISDIELRNLYYKSAIHVCNSVDNFESGTLPILEAMFCGVPVLTRKVGHVPDLYNGENMAIYDGDPEDVIAITEKLKEFYYDKKNLENVRQKAWNTVKSRNFERRAYMYQKLYREVLYPDTVPVSVVIPINDKPEVIRRVLDAVDKQTYRNMEIIVCDDSGNFRMDVLNFRRYSSLPIRYINTSRYDNTMNKDYGLARARNTGIVEATGEIMVFIDQRMIPEPDAVQQFVNRIKTKTWLYGNKGEKKEFVENFSCVYRKEVIECGMFNERMEKYGGLSQELRNRIRAQGFQIEYIEKAKAIPSGKSSNRNTKRKDIISMKNRLWKMGLE